MGEVRGFVTRTRGAENESIFGVTVAQDTPPLSRNEFVASKSDGTLIGSFPTSRQAESAVERSTVGDGLLKWTMTRLTSGQQQYVGTSTDFFPGDLGDLLLGGAWWRADQGIQLGPNTVDPRNVRRWFSHEGGGQTSASALVVADAPVIADSALGGRPAVRFSVGDTERMATTLSGVIPAPMTVLAVATYVDASREQKIIESDGGMEFRVSAGGDLEVVSGATTITGPAIASGTSMIVSIIMTATGAEAFLDGVSIGSAGTVAVSGEWTISDGTSSWAEDISEIIIVPSALNSVLHDKLVRYAQERYLLA